MLSMRQHSSLSPRNCIGMDMAKEPNESSSIVRTIESKPDSKKCLQLLTRNEVDALYELMEVVDVVLNDFKIEYIVLGGTLLGAVRSESILFNADNVDIAVIDDGYTFHLHKSSLPDALSREAHQRSAGKMTLLYQHQDECDRIRSTAEQSQVLLNLFVLRKYEKRDCLTQIVQQADIEVQRTQALFERMRESIPDSAFPLFHFDHWKAIEHKPQHYFTQIELRPLVLLPFGPLTVSAPLDSIGPLKRFFGPDCFIHDIGATSSTADRPTHPGIGCQPRPLSLLQYRPVQHSRRGNISNHSWDALKFTLTKYKKERESERIIPVKSSTMTGGICRTRSHFAFEIGSETQSSAIVPSHSPKLDQAASITPPKSFGHDVRQIIGDDPESPVFDRKLRAVMEPHIARARRERDDQRNPVVLTYDPSIASAVGVPYTALRDERRFLFDHHSYPLHQVLTETLGVDDLTQLHSSTIKCKDDLLAPLLTREGRNRFHECYINFVTSFCIPLLHSLAITKDILKGTSQSLAPDVKYRFQAFPSLSIVFPGELSTNPSCDTALGHSIGNLNFHVPLTAVFGTNALYAESHPGREDWHGFTTKSPGLGFLFDAARCLHFTLENTTNVTRVAIDFRVAIYREGSDEDGLCPQALLADRFSNAEPGYYYETSINFGMRSLLFPVDGHITKNGGKRLIDPDARVGYPFTM